MASSFKKKITMKKVSLLLTVSVIIIFGCNSKLNTDHSNIKEEVSKLVSPDDKRNFFRQILEDDQKVRDSEKAAELMLKYGNNSKEHREYTKAQQKQDEINIKKIEAYFEKFDYPLRVKLGRDAAMAPWLVIHHLTDTGLRDKHFEILYKAYLNGDIEDTQLSLYLDRSYNFIFGERYQMKSPYRSEDQINILIEKLGLEERRAKIKR